MPLSPLPSMDMRDVRSLVMIGVSVSSTPARDRGTLAQCGSAIDQSFEAKVNYLQRSF